MNRTLNECVSGRSRSMASIVLMVAGLLAIALPFLAGLSLSVVLGCSLVAAGGAYAALAYGSRNAGLAALRFLIAMFFLFAGADLVLHPAFGLITLTLIIAFAFSFEGIAEILSCFRVQRRAGSGWLLINGIVTLILALMIWQESPASSVWAIGTLVGINLLTSGIAPMRFYVQN